MLRALLFQGCACSYNLVNAAGMLLQAACSKGSCEPERAGTLLSAS